MDARDLEFHRRVRQGFLVLASQFPDRWLMLDATRPLDDLRRQIARRLEDAGLLA
jgi:dTMP kinase